MRRHTKPSFQPNLEPIREVLVEVSTLPEIETPRQIIVTPPSSEQTPILPPISSPTKRLIVPHDYFEPTIAKQPQSLPLSLPLSQQEDQVSDEREHQSIRQVVASEQVMIPPLQHPASPLCSTQPTTPHQYSTTHSPPSPSK